MSNELNAQDKVEILESLLTEEQMKEYWKKVEELEGEQL